MWFIIHMFWNIYEQYTGDSTRRKCENVSISDQFVSFDLIKDHNLPEKNAGISFHLANIRVDHNVPGQALELLN